MLLKAIKSLSQTCLFYCLSVILFGCSFAPKYIRPPIPVAEEYPRGTGPQKYTNIRQFGWNVFFTDPALKQLIALSLNNNRDLRTAIERMGEARAMYGLQKADLFPSLNANALGLKAGVPGNLLPNMNPFVFSAYLGALSVSSWEIDFWGRLRNLKDAALEHYLATEDAEHATFISLIEQVANTYLTEHELNELIHITLKTIKSRKHSYHLMKRRFEEGSSSKFEVVQAETLLQQANSELTVLERKRELNWNAMTLLVGTQIPINQSRLARVAPSYIKEISPGLPSELLYNRPDVIAAEHRLKAANANIGAARAAFFPRITLTGAYGTTSSELNNLFSPGTKIWTYFPNITLPIFDWGRNMSDLGLAKARQNLAITEYEHTIQVAFREVADALANRTWLAKQIIVQNKALASQKERTHLAWARYKVGSSPYLEVLDAERDKFAAEQSLVQTRYELLASQINLYVALGGGHGR